MISRLQMKTGEVYALSQNWPGADVKNDNDPNQLKVGPIFRLPGEEEPVYETDDEGESTGEISASYSLPPRYEVWCVTDRVLSIMMAQLHNKPIPEEELAFIQQAGAGMTRRIVYLDCVRAVDEDWPAAKAFLLAAVERYNDMSRADEEEAQAREERNQQQQVAAPSNGQPMAPQAGG